MNDRLKEQEILLRFFALYYDLSSYERPLKIFLNKFMTSNRNLDKYDSEMLDSIIYPTIKYANNVLGKKAFRMGGRINAALFDSIMIGVAKRFEKGNFLDEKDFIHAYDKLMKDTSFTSLAKEGTADENTVRNRIRIAIDQFSSL
jgi:hypothetical protein